APYTVEHDVAVPMPDGVTLLASLYRPAGEPGPRPVVLIRTPYGRDGSSGQFRPFTTEQDDGLATLDWVRKQSWCDGRVAMTGGSYFGHTQWAVVPYAEPPLVAFSPHVAAARSSTVLYDHGVPQVQNALNWSGLIGSQERGGLRRVLTAPVLRTRAARALRRLPLQAADVA